MTLKIDCPSCAATFRLPDTAAGKAFKCKQCGEKVRVPSDTQDDPLGLSGHSTPMSAAGGASEPEPMAFPVGFAQTSKRRSRMPTKTLALAGGGAVLLLAMVGVLIVMLGDSGEEEVTEPDRLGIAGGSDTRYAWQTDEPERSSTPQPRPAPDARQTSVPQRPSARQSESTSPATNGPPRAETLTPAFVPQPPPSDRRPSAPAIAWLAEPDPLDEAFEVSGRLNLNINDRWENHLLLSDAIGPFVAVGQNRYDADKRVFIDTRTGEAVWHIKGRLPDVKGVDRSYDDSSISLSPDGQRLAITGSNSDGHYLLVYNNDRDTPRYAYKIGERRPLGQRVLMSDTDTVLYYERLGTNLEKIVAYDVATGEARWSYTDLKDARGLEKTGGLSANGKYLVVPENRGSGQTLSILETESGPLVGQIDVETGRLASLSFSPDGRRLAGLFDRTGVWVWDFTSGALISSTPLNSELIDRRLHGARLALIDNDGLACLNGDIYLDTNSGRLYSDYTPENQYAATRFVVNLHGEQAIRFDKETSRSGKPANRISAASYDPEAMRASFSLIDSGFDLAEANLPTLEQTLVINAEPPAVELETDADAIALQTSAPPTERRAAVKIEFPPGEPIDHGPGIEKLNRIQVTNVDDNGQALALHTDGRVFLFHTLGKTRPKVIDTPAPMRPLWLSPDGKRMIGRTGRYRLSVLDLDTGDLLGSWRVREDNQQARTHRITPGVLEEARLLHGNQLWVRNSNDTVCVIDTNTNQLIDTGKRLETSLWASTDDGGYLMTTSRLRDGRPVLQLIDTQTRSVAAEYIVPGQWLHSAALCPHTGKAAAVIRDGSQSRLVVIDLQAKQQLSDSMLPSNKGNSVSKSVRWIDDRYLLLGSHIVDSTTGRHLWSTRVDGRSVPRAGLVKSIGMQSLWHGQGSRDRGGEAFLISAALPLDKVVQKASRDPKANQPTGWLIGPGTKVRVEVSGVADGQALVESIEKRFEEEGLIKDNAAPYVLRVSQTSESKTQAVESFGPGGIQQGTITEQTVLTTYEWVGPKDEVVWRRVSSNSAGLGLGYDRVTVENPGDSAIAAKQREINEQIERGRVRSYSGPVTLPETIDSQLLGTSELTMRGYQSVKQSP